MKRILKMRDSVNRYPAMPKPAEVSAPQLDWEKKNITMAIKEKQPRSPGGRYGLTFFGLLIMLSISTGIFGAQIAAQNDVAAKENPVYQGLQPNQFFKKWFVLGPIPVSTGKTTPDQDKQKKKFEAEPPFRIKDLSSARSGHQIGDKEYQWQLVASENEILDLNQICGKTEFAEAYAWAEIHLSEPKNVLLGIGSDDGIRVWLNGQLIHQNRSDRPVLKDQDLVSVTFKKGKNQLLLKIQNGRWDWGFCCRVLGSETLPRKLVETAGLGDLDTLEMLLSHGADINATTYGLTALHYARIRGRDDVVTFLREKGTNPKIPMPAPETVVDAFFKGIIKEDFPGAAVLIAQNGEILYQKGFGYANLENQIPITPQTKFRIGSITKQFTASAILKLQEESLLKVTDRLSKFLPDYPRGDEVTIHHLLTHTSGIHDYTNHPEFASAVETYIEAEEMIELFKADKFDFDPGEKWSYSNSGYFLLGYIVEKVSGQSLKNYLKHHFFDPTGMTNTEVHDSKQTRKNETTGYSYAGGEPKKAVNWDMSRAGGAGNLHSTIQDLYRWNEAVFNGKLLNQNTLKSAFTPVKINDKNQDDAHSSQYGYGWTLMEKRGLKEIGHSGGLPGWMSYLTRYPKQNLTITILANASPTNPNLVLSALADRIAEIYLWQQMKPMESFATDKTVDISDDYIGQYDYAGGIMTITRERDQLFAQLTGQPKFEIFPKSETEFFWKVVDAQITFVRNKKGEVAHIIHHQSGQTLKAPRLEQKSVVQIDTATYGDYVGEYDYGHGAILTITKERNRLLAQMTGQPKFEIFPQSETEFFWKVANAQVTFVKNDKGNVNKIRHYQAGTEIQAPKIK
ncbi:TPA: DUF3471 domain-containing protein [Candidatus Poribacteria bacterium]|nr:DUF3471 domain-containing protein [Candidatus Poribacteria bacterium]